MAGAGEFFVIVLVELGGEVGNRIPVSGGGFLLGGRVGDVSGVGLAVGVCCGARLEFEAGFGG